MSTWPYGYYVLLRIWICGATAFLTYRQWSRRGRFDAWAVVLGVVAVLDNPLIRVHLTKVLWTFYNLGTTALLLEGISGGCGDDGISRTRPTAVDITPRLGRARRAGDGGAGVGGEDVA